MARDLVEEYLQETKRRRDLARKAWMAEQDAILKALPTPMPPGTQSPPPPPTPPERRGVIQEGLAGLMRGGASIGQAIGVLQQFAGDLSKDEIVKAAGVAAAESWAQTAEAAAPGEAIRGSVWDNPHLALDPEWWASSIAESLPSLAASMVPGAGVGVALNVGGKLLPYSATTVARLARIGAMSQRTGAGIGAFLEGASTYQTVKARGGTDEDAAAAMAWMGLATFGLERASLSRLLPSPAKAPVPGFGRRVVSGGTAEAVTEYLESPAEAVILGDDVIRSLKEGVNVALPSFVLGGGAAALGGAAPTQRALGAPPVAQAAPAVVPPGAPPVAPEVPPGAPVAAQAPPAGPPAAAPTPPAGVAPPAARAAPAPTVEPARPPVPEMTPTPAIAPESVGAAGAGTLATGVESRVNTRHLDTTREVRDQVEVLDSTPSTSVLEDRERQTAAQLRAAAALSAFTVDDALRITPESTPIRKEEAYRLRQYAEMAVRRALLLSDRVAGGDKASQWQIHPAFILAGRLVEGWELEARKAGRLLQSYNATVEQMAREMELLGLPGEYIAATRAWGELTAAQKEEIKILDAMMKDQGPVAATTEPTSGAPTPAPGPDIGPALQQAATRKEIADLADILRGAPDASPTYIAEMLRRLLPPQQQLMVRNVTSLTKATGAAVFEYWINALLSGPLTQIVNVMSVGLNTIWAVPERALMGRWAWMRGDPHSVQEGEAAAMLRGIIEGFSDALKVAAKAWREERAQIPVIRQGQMVSVPQHYGKTEIYEPAIRAGAFNLEGTSVGAAIDFLGHVIRIPTTLMATADSFFRAINARMEIKALALRQARIEGYEGAGLVARVIDLELHPPAQIMEAANQQGLLRSFQQQPGPLGTGVLTFANNFPPIRIFVPFIRTPANILDFSLQHTPGLNFFSAAWRADWAAGGARRDTALARLSTGVLLTTTLVALAAAEIITGAGPTDPDLRREKEATGWRPYSWRIGGTYYSYKRLDPLGAIMGLVSNTAEVIGQMSDADALDVAGAVVFATMRNMSDKTYLEGIGNLLELLEQPERGWKTWVDRQAASLVPTLLGTVTRAVDPVVREADSVVDGMRKKIPGFSTTVRPRRNIFAEKILLEGGWAEHLISPVYRAREVRDPVALEIARLQANISMPPRVLRGRAPAAFGRPPVPEEEVGVRLNDEQYDKFVRYAGNELKHPETGRGMKDDLGVLLKTPVYEAASDVRREEMIKHIVTAHRERARRQLIAEDPALRQALQYQAEVRQAARRGEARPPNPLEALAGGIGR
jgi:hypothetical protein